MTGWMICAVAIVAALGFALWVRRREKRRLARMTRMLDDAFAGEFRPERYDESLESSVESKLRDCLAATELARSRLQGEKRDIESLVSDIAHQTRTPVVNLLLYAQLLTERELPPEAREIAASMEAQAEKLRLLMDALVKASRLDAGMLAMRPEQNSLQALMDAAAEQLRPAAEAKGIALQIERMQATASFDPKWTGEALCNLLDNAVKYSPPGSCVRLAARQGELFSRVDVIDEGPGVPEADRGRIFARFYRGANHAQDEGVGLGLYLAREIVAGQGGYVKLSCPEGGGSVFSLFLPSLSKA